MVGSGVSGKHSGNELVCFRAFSCKRRQTYSRHFFEESERIISKVELSLISFISLLVFCAAVPVPVIKQFVKNSTNAGVRSSLASRFRPLLSPAAATGGLLLLASPTFAQSHEAGEASLTLPDLSRVTFFGGVDGHTLLLTGLVVCVLGLGFGMAMYMNLKRLPVHRAMREISELIYETCKTYLITQGCFRKSRR